MKDETTPGGTALAAPAAPIESLLGPLETSTMPVYCRDAAGIVTAANVAFDRKFGRAGQTLTGVAVDTLIHPEDRAAFQVASNRPSRMVPDSGRMQRWYTSHGWRWFAWDESPVYDANSEHIGVRSVGRDITRQRLAEELYLKLSRAVDQSPVAIAITDAEGRIQYVNPKFVHATGHSLEDILDRKVAVLREGHPSDESYQQFWDTVRSGGEWRGELSRTKPDGSSLWESVHVSCMRNASGEITNLLCLREDITERRRLQDELRQAQKMESLGTLAGGIAHDFNNLLGVMTGYAEIAGLHAGDPAMLQKSLKEIIRAAQRASGLVRQILTFSRKAETHFEPLDFNQLVRDLTALLSETFPRMVNFGLDLMADLPPLLADHNQMQQVVLNLCVNARDAMPAGGVLMLTTRLCPGSELDSPHADKDKTYACLQVSDTGVGMTQEVRNRIFEPFFTTKEVNQGTGLGLAVVYGIVTSHQGFIDVDSTPGVGSKFRIYIPLAENTAIPVVTVPSTDFPGGKESILVVDDEDPLRQLLNMALSGKGYRVTCACNGLEAIDFISNRDFVLDLVLLDLNMPGATGLEVLKVIKAMRPQLKVLVMSGHLRPEARAEIERLGENCFVHKPYTLDELGRRMRGVLGK
jgi:two-component system cell cycle sensor histidine kinase/response regulator CckA